MVSESRRAAAAVVTRLRSGRDLIAYLVRHEWVFAVGLTTVLLGIVSALPFGWARHFGWVVLVVGTALSLWLLWNDTRALFKRFSVWEFEAVDPVFGSSDVITDSCLPLRVTMNRGSVFTSPELNAMLSNSPDLVWRPTPFRLEGELHDHAASLVRQSTSARRPFNGPCVRLEDDLSVASLQRGESAIMRPARYFDTLCSNQLTAWNITRDGDPWLFRERYLFGDGTTHRGETPVHRLQTLGRSVLANAVGVSTLAVTRDDQLLVVLQSANAGSSARLRAPSGSGSLEPRDVGDEPHLLDDVVIRGALRELQEECAVAETEILDSAVIGYGRWLEHGAKPEFIVLTALDMEAQTVRRRPDWLSAEEATWTQSVRTVPLRLDRAVDRLALTAHDSVAARMTGDEHMAGSASVPLEFGLRCLAVALDDDPGLLDRLRRSTRTRRTV